MVLDLSRLDRFIAVAESGSINKAATATGISQAGLTKSIRHLEEQLQARLFDRSARGVALTREGQAFLTHARLIINQREAAVSAVRAQSEGRDVTLRVGIAPRWVLRTVMPEIVARMLDDERRPQLVVSSGQKSWQMIERMREGDLDILVATPSRLDDLTGITVNSVVHDSQGVAVRREHPLAGRRNISLKDLSEYDWISGSAETYFRRYLTSLYMARGMQPPKPVVIADSNTMILDVIARTDLLGIATQQLINVGHDERITMLRLASPVKRELAILTRTNDVLPQTGIDLISTLHVALKARVLATGSP